MASQCEPPLPQLKTLPSRRKVSARTCENFAQRSMSSELSIKALSDWAADSRDFFQTSFVSMMLTSLCRQRRVRAEHSSIFRSYQYHKMEWWKCKLPFLHFA